MYIFSDLKQKISVFDSYVECPIRGCTRRVVRQRKHFRRESKFQCPVHNVYISPSTFEYPSEEDNLLWTSREDLDLLKSIKRVKRESRMARDNSEDAVTWNVFRYLETTRQLSPFLSSIAGVAVGEADLIYWSFSQEEHGTWSELARARDEFGEDPKRSSEPDLIAVSDRAVFWIEAKVTATNVTTPSNPSKTKNYLSGGKGWHQQVFLEDFQTIAMNSKLYELYRFWLLGTWSATQSGRDFYLVNLVRSGRDLDIEQRFGQYINQTPLRTFRRLTWEDIFRHITLFGSTGPDLTKMLDYFRNKTIGYDLRRELRLAFDL